MDRANNDTRDLATPYFSFGDILSMGLMIAVGLYFILTSGLKIAETLFGSMQYEGIISPKEPPPPTPVKTIKILSEKPSENLIAPPFQAQQYRFLEGLIPALMLILAVAVLIILHRTNK